MKTAGVMLVLLAQQGDRDALNRLLQGLQERLFRYISRLLSGDAAGAEDVLQETLLRIARKLPWLSEATLFEAWAYRIASREVYRAFAASQQSEPLDEDLTVPAGEPPALSADELNRMTRSLSPASRAVLLLHYEEDRPLEEIATILSIPLGTVKSRLAYGLKRLREMVRP